MQNINTIIDISNRTTTLYIFPQIMRSRLMSKCNCEKYQGGRGSGIGYRYIPTGRAVQFDAPHPGKELYTYQIKAVIEFLKSVGEI